MGADDAVARSFDRGADAYEDLLRQNALGARRLVQAIGPGPFRDVLDVGCGTGFLSEAMAAGAGAERITGVDPSEGMLERFRAKLGDIGAEVTLTRAGVLDMPVPDAAFDAVVTGMAFHWFPDKAAAVAAMARRLRPGGTLGILAAGRGADDASRRLLERLEPAAPAAWIAAYHQVQRDAGELTSYLVDAGLEVVDVWEEHRLRVVDPEVFIARNRLVGGHLSEGDDPDETEAHAARYADAIRAAAGPSGFGYRFVKLFGVARRPA